jgi:hypothetical protein
MRGRSLRGRSGEKDDREGTGSMSLDLTISVIYKERRKSDAFLDLLRRLRTRSTGENSRICEIVSGNEEDNYRNIAPIQGIGELERIFGLKNRIQVGMAYVLRSGRPVTVTLSYTAEQYWGNVCRDLGPLTLWVTLNELARPLWQLGGDDKEIALNNPVLTNACIKDAEDLFFTACGVLDSDNSSACVKHAVMFADFGFVSPLGCAMIYHHDVSEVLTDFPRMYCAHHFGTNPISALDTDLDLWRLAPIGSETNRPGRLNADPYRDIHEPDGEQVIGFLDNLEETPLARLKTITNERMKEWFRFADLNRWQIHCHELPHGSFALTSYPLFTLWRAYAEFYHAMTEAS